MKKRTIVYSIITVIIIITVLTLYAWKEYNRKPIDLRNTKANYTLYTKILLNDFSLSDSTSNAKYMSQIIELTGSEYSIDSSNKSAYTIVLSEKDFLISIRCSLDSTEKMLGILLNSGKEITIKGIYTGYNADDLGLGADIIINKCILINK